MRRKVIQIANSTQLISLPRKWALEHDIKKGDELEVGVEGNKVIVTTENSLEPDAVEINPPYVKNVTERIITSYYRSGIKDIKINLDPSSQDGFLSFINQKMDGQTIGFEIVQHEKNYFCIKDLSGTDVSGFDSALRRSFLLLTTMAEEIIVAVEKKDKEKLKNMYFSDRSINKFTNFCARELISIGDKGLKQTAFYYHFLRSLEALADQFSLFATYYADHLEPLPKEALVLYKKLFTLLTQFQTVFFKYDQEGVNVIFTELKKIDIKKYYNLENVDCVVIGFFDKIHRRLKEILDCVIEINL